MQDGTHTEISCEVCSEEDVGIVAVGEEAEEE